MYNRELLDYVINTKKDNRKYICEQEFAIFAMYYFAEFFIYKIPAFQWLMYKMLKEFTEGKFKYILWVMFRESSKTTITKMYLTYCICYRKKRFINWDAYDKGNSEAALFDIATWLQTNKRILADFGQLFYEESRHTERKQAALKRINEFITVNKIKVKAYSTQESTRGRIFDRYRPDLYILDDIETEKTMTSVPVTGKIIEHLNTLKTGMSVDGQAIFLGNLISTSGSIATLIAESQENKDLWRYMRVDVEKDGEISWPDKFVWTRDEAAEANTKIQNRAEYKVSLEQKKRDLNAGGKKVYEAEMMNNPEVSGELFFDRDKIEADMKRAKVKPPIKIIGGLSIWEPYIARNRYAFGGDTAKGVQRDSCTSVGIRFAETSAVPAVVIATYASNEIKPDLFGDEMASHGRMFGECLLAPELNATGYATVTRLKAIYPIAKIYRQVREDQAGKVITKDLGWEATSANVATIYYNFRSAHDNGEIVVYCPALLAEMYSFTRRDLEGAVKKAEQLELTGIITRHFDLLRAACIAWDMRLHTRPAQKKAYKQADPERVSEYHG